MAQPGPSFELRNIPILLQKEIIKKMKLKSVVTLQKTTKHYLNLVDGCHSMILDKYHRVRDYKSLYDKYYVFRGRASERLFLTINLARLMADTRKYQETPLCRQINEEFLLTADIIDVWTHIFDD